MTDLLKLILGVLASLFRSEHSWRRRKIWSCGSKSESAIFSIFRSCFQPF